MKFENIKSQINDIIADRYVVDENTDYVNKLKSLAHDDLINKWVFRIKRKEVKINSWKTLVFIEITADDDEKIKFELKEAVNWIALIKESLLGEENTDLYLFLAFNNNVSEEECLRIESTEQFCRKYVLLPGEKISEFLNRTFLQKINNIDTIDAEDPIERAFSKTAAHFNWLTPEIQKTWKKAFSNLSGSELSDVLLRGKINYDAY